MPVQTGAAKCRISLFLPWKRSTRNLDFLARAITEAESETVWEEAQAQRC
jgi:hypothetical protein